MKKNTERICHELNNQLDDLTRDIRSHEELISTHKSSIRDIDQELRITRNEMKNAMTQYGVSSDIVTSIVVPTKRLGAAKDVFEVTQSPRAEDIEILMGEVDSLEREIEELEDEIFRIGVELRDFYDQRDDVQRELRRLGC